MKPKHHLIGMLAVALLGIAVAIVTAAGDIDEFRSCSYCGMDRKAYGYSRMMVTYANGLRAGVCSLHCAITDMNAHKDRAVRALQVADRNSHTLIDAEKAVWVIGGSKRGVMSQTPTWAFATKDAAQEFVASNGGSIATWDAALLAAR